MGRAALAETSVSYRSIVRASWILLAGCWSTPPPAPPSPRPEPPITIRSKSREPSHCERAIDHVVMVMQPELDRNATLKDRRQLLRDAAIEGCLSTGWSEEALTCYDNTVDIPSLPPCFEQLSDDQRKDFNDRMTATMKQPVP